MRYNNLGFRQNSEIQLILKFRLLSEDSDIEGFDYKCNM